MMETDNIRSENTSIAPEQDYLPTLEKVSPASEEELLQYQKKLRQYFLDSKKISVNQQTGAAPVLVAPYLTGRKTDADFPLLVDHGNLLITSLLNALQGMFNELFEPDEAESLSQRLPHISSVIEEKLAAEDPVCDFNVPIKEILKNLSCTDQNDTESKLFKKQCEQFEKHLLTKKGTLIGYSAFSAFHLLNLQLEKQNEQNHVFLQRLRKSITGIKEILQLHEDETDRSQNHFDFASDLISFDKMDDMVPAGISSSLTEGRLNRLRHCLDTLSKAYSAHTKNFNIIFVREELAREFDLKKIMRAAVVEITETGSCTKALKYFRKEMDKFVRVIAALRLADLEINQNYDDDLHAPYFESFDLSFLSDDDLSYFRPLIVVEESRRLMLDQKGFLTLLSNDALVKVLTINKHDEFIGFSKQVKDDDTYLELAALAMFRRNACVYQGALDNPSWLNDTFRKGLDAACPVLWNILIAGGAAKRADRDLPVLKTAVHSRYFPQLVYDIRSGEGFASHFDISGNPQPTESFPVFTHEIRSPSGKQTCPYYLTMADYLALDDENLKMLEFVPAGFSSENLIPLAEYLVLPHDSLSGKIPFLWMVDEKGHLKQAAIPLSWLQRCRARLEYWRFLQELAGANSYHAKRAVAEAKSAWETEKDAELEALKTRLQADFDRIRRDDTAKAINRMLNRLLGNDEEITTLLQQPDSAPMTPEEEVKKMPASKDEQEIENLKPLISTEVWVDSDQCTSCSDCIDALPSVFKYNDDKQAFVHNPKGGTYAKIVSLAEKCPARCIHPGLPQDPSEPGGEKLIRRAEKFN